MSTTVKGIVTINDSEFRMFKGTKCILKLILKYDINNLQRNFN